MTSSRWPASPEITIGETLAVPEDPRPLPLITVDEPSLSVTIGINTSPLAGHGGRPSSPLASSRRGSTTSSSATFRYGCAIPTGPRPGRFRAGASSQLAVLVELMRREGYELTVGKPQVVMREIDGTATSRWSG